MQITLDTSTETKESLIKIARFLDDLAGNKSYKNNEDVVKEAPDASQGIFNIFGDDNEEGDERPDEKKENDSEEDIEDMENVRITTY